MSPAATKTTRRPTPRAFTNGWFRTGDQGVKDADDYISMTGRLKEIINRGGEKISPREVDEALMDHPAVLQVVTFAVPHDMLGEDVAAAVVLRDGATVSDKNCARFCPRNSRRLRRREKFCFSAKSLKARPANYNASDWRKNWGSPSLA